MDNATYNSALDHALTEIDECITNYRRGLFSPTDLSQGIWDVLLDISLKGMRRMYSEIIPLCAEYLIVDGYAVSQLKNVISEWGTNWKIGIYNFMEDINKKTSISDAEKLAYYRAYIVLDNYPEYGNEN